MHRDGKPDVPHARASSCYVGDVRNRDLLANLLRRVDAVYHFAAYQDYLPDFARFTDVNVVSTALIYEIAVAERLDLQRIVVASSQSAMGEGLYRCPATASRRPGMRPEAALRGRRVGHPLPACAAARWRCSGRPSGSRTRRTPTGCRSTPRRCVAINLGRRYDIPTVALRYSIVQGPRQSVYNAYSGACRIFCLHYLQGGAPTLYEDGRAIRDYVNIDDVVDANVLVLDRRARRRPGVQRRRRHAVHDAGVRRGRPRAVRLGPAGAGSPGSTGSATPGTSSPTSTPCRRSGWEPRDTPAESVAAYAEWLKAHAGPRRRARRRRRDDARRSASSGRPTS